MECHFSKNECRSDGADKRWPMEKSPPRRIFMAIALVTVILLGQPCCDDVKEADHAEVHEVSGPRVKLSTDELDFGKVWADEELKKTVQVSNAGAEPLIVEAVQATCPCIVPAISKTNVPPGEATELVVGLVLHEYPVNQVKGKVILRTSDPVGNPTQISVRAEIRPEFVVEPERLDFGKVKRGQGPTRQLIVRQSGPAELVLKGVEAPPQLLVSVAKATAEDASQTNDVEKVPTSYQVDVTIAPETPNGRLSAKLTLLTNIERVPKVRVRVAAEVIGVECVTSPRVVVFGPDPPGTRVGAIEVIGVHDIEVLEASSTIDDVALKIEAIESLKRYRVEVRLKDDAVPGDKVGWIVLTLKEGRLTESKKLAVYGTVLGGCLQLRSFGRLSPLSEVVRRAISPCKTSGCRALN